MISPRLIHGDARAFRERSTMFYTYTHAHAHGHGQTPQIQTLTAAGGLASGGQDSFFFPFPPFPFAPPSPISADPTPPQPPPRCFGETCKASTRKACTPCPPPPCPMFSTCASTAVACTSGCRPCSSPPASSLSHLSACDTPAITHPRPHVICLPCTCKHSSTSTCHTRAKWALGTRELPYLHTYALRYLHTYEISPYTRNLYSLLSNKIVHDCKQGLRGGMKERLRGVRNEGEVAGCVE